MSMRSSDLPNRVTKMKQKFSEKEKYVLAREVMAHANELFTKDAVKILGKNITVKRHNIWSLVAKEVSKVDRTNRTIEDCQSAWNNYKRQITRTIDEIKKVYFNTHCVEPLENFLDDTQRHVVYYFKMDSDLEQKSQQLSGHSSLQEDGIQNRPVTNQLSLSPATCPTEAALILQQTAVAASSSSPMTLASSVGTAQCSPITSISHTGSSMLSLGRPSENQTSYLERFTMNDYLPLSPQPPSMAATQLTETAVPSVRATSSSITSQSFSRSKGQTTPLIQKKRPTPSTSMISSYKILPKSLDEKVEELQRYVYDIQKELKTVKSKCVGIKNMLQNITERLPK